MDSLEQLPTPPPFRRQPPLRWVPVLLVVTLIFTIGMLALYATPALVLRWWLAEAQADADAAYLKRQAELKAESEAADRRLDALDGRFRLVSLGFREVARKVAPVVVNIRSEVEATDADEALLFFDHDTKRVYVEQAEGSGILVKPGYVLTNHHVLRKAQRLRVLFANGSSVTVKPDAVSSDALTDLAVVRLPLNPGGGPAQSYEVHAEFADSDRDVQVGDWVLAAGSPFGLKQTVTAGIISAKGRVELGILDQVDLLQTDAAINPGNSGGPLFDQRGRVVGINVAIASKTGGNQGVGFAIPSNTARAIFEDLVEHGEVVRAFLGVGMQELSDDLERRLRIHDTGGVLVNRVQPGSPAAQAGLREGDIITRYNGSPVGNGGNAVNQLRRRIAATEPETEVPIEFLRGKRRLSVTATVVRRATEIR